MRLLGALSALLLCVAAAAQVAVPVLEARVTDLTGTLTAEQQAGLEDKLAAFESRKGSQIAVLLVPSTEPEDIDQFAIRVAEQWKLGRKKVDDGALLIIAKNDRRMRIEVGYGLEGVLTDAMSKRIIAETITPLFRQGDLYGGINAGVEQMIRVVDGEPLPEPDKTWKGEGSGSVMGALPVLFFVTLIVASILNRILGRGLGALGTGVVTGGVVWVIAKILGIALLAGFIGTLFALFSGASRRGWSSSARRGGWGGGWGGLGGGGLGGGGFGGGGGGGFGGGGGGFGGGGASGGW